MSLEQLRDRMPQLRQRDQTLQRELDAIAAQTRDRAAYLRLAETLSAFLARLRDAADTLDITERQRIVRLVVKEVLVDEETIVIRHSVPVPSGPPSGGSGPPTREADDAADHRSYLLRTGRDDTVCRLYTPMSLWTVYGGSFGHGRRTLVRHVVDLEREKRDRRVVVLGVDDESTRSPNSRPAPSSISNARRRDRRVVALEWTTRARDRRTLGWHVVARRPMRGEALKIVVRSRRLRR